MIELIDIYKTYETNNGEFVALQDINLKIKKGEIFGVIGPSGAGKSTLLRCINLLERPTKGQVLINQQNLIPLPEKELRNVRRKIGMIFQHFNLLFSRTVSQNVMFPLELQKQDKKSSAKKVLDLLEWVGIADKKDFYPHQLSGGQKQRVAIARALVNDPQILLCDEATSSLDPTTTHSILQLLNEINKKLDLTILLITHEMSVVKEVCHRLAIMEHGKIIEESEVIHFFGKPETKIAKEFVRKSLKQHLPDSLKNRVVSNHVPNSIPLWQIAFFGKAAEEPFISSLISKFHINLNILHANIETVRGETVGIMVVEAEGEKNQLEKGMQYLFEKGISVEVVGYVKRD